MARCSPSLSAKRHLALVGRISHWLKIAGIRNAQTRANVSIDLADGLHAADQIRAHLREMLGCDPSSRRGADRALKHWGHIDALAFTELWMHLRSLKRTWESKVGVALSKPKRTRRAAA